MVDYVLGLIPLLRAMPDGPLKDLAHVAWIMALFLAGAWWMIPVAIIAATIGRLWVTRKPSFPDKSGK